MPGPVVTVVIPTLSADEKLVECLGALEKQTRPDFEVMIVDNSGKGLAQQAVGSQFRATVIEPGANVGFATAVNLGFRKSNSPFVAPLNDDAVAHPEWLESLLAAAEAHPEAGMCASQVRLYAEDQLDSAGMVICGDGSSKQRGHLYPPDDFNVEEEILFPSASAALYRRAMLDEIGLFDEDFFLYCEDTDLGLRAQRAGWKCIYTPRAIVEHHYSHSAGRASRLKAYQVERNRLFVLLKNFPARMLWRAPFVTLARYWWHLRSMSLGRGTTAQFRREGNSSLQLALIVFRAHWALLMNSGALWRKRREIKRRARLTASDFARLLRAHSIKARRVAEL